MRGGRSGEQTSGASWSWGCESEWTAGEGEEGGGGSKGAAGASNWAAAAAGPRLPTTSHSPGGPGQVLSRFSIGHGSLIRSNKLVSSSLSAPNSPRSASSSHNSPLLPFSVATSAVLCTRAGTC